MSERLSFDALRETKITGHIAWGNGEPCPICGKSFEKPDIPHLLSHPEAMGRLFPEPR